MATLNWPASLPSALLLGFTFKPRRNYFETNPDGPGQRRPKGTGALWDLSGDVVLDDAQVATLSSFHDVDTKSGSEWFNFPHPFTGATVETRFAGEPEIRATRSSISRVALALELKGY